MSANKFTCVILRMLISKQVLENYMCIHIMYIESLVFIRNVVTWLSHDFVPLFQAVFRMYTKDKLDAISIHEFQALQSNFPFIENFSVVDENK